MANNNRNKRISEEIKKVVSELISYGELKDPNISQFTSIMSVETTRDLRYCYIYISTYDLKSDKEKTVDALNKAKGFIRSEVAKKINLRYTPEMIFKIDNSVDNAALIENKLNEIKSR